MRTASASYNHQLRYTRLQNLLLIRWLYMVNWITGRSLQLSLISEPGSVLLSGGCLTLYWEVKGCHQVTINNTILLPGTTGFIRLDPAQLIGPLVLRFEGCKENIVKICNLVSAELQIKQLVRADLQEPKLRTLELYTQWPPLRPKRLSGINLPATILPPALRVHTQPAPATIRTAMLHLQLESCELPQFNP